jgi:hypothetical protein
MARVAGDKNHTVREQRLIAENAALKAEIKAIKASSKATLKVKDLRIKELSKRI